MPILLLVLVFLFSILLKIISVMSTFHATVIESDPCCFQVSIACEPEKPEDEDCKGNGIRVIVYVSKVCYEPRRHIMPGLISGFCSMKRIGVFLLPLDGMPVHRRDTPYPKH